MRLLRLIRLMALLSYWAPVMHDLRAVLLRRERSRQVLVMGAMVGLLSFTGALVLDQLETGVGTVDYDEDGEVTAADHRFVVHLWWAFRQIQDPGNMLAAPGSGEAVAVSMVLTVFGLLLTTTAPGELGATSMFPGSWICRNAHHRWTTNLRSAAVTSPSSS